MIQIEVVEVGKIVLIVSLIYKVIVENWLGICVVSFFVDLVGEDI